MSIINKKNDYQDEKTIKMKLKFGYLIGFVLSILSAYYLTCFMSFPPKATSNFPLKPILSISALLRFQIIGDFGELAPKSFYPKLPVRIVAESMNSFAQNNSISMVLTVGDNFYPRLNSVFDFKSYKVIEEIFNLTYVHRVPWYYLYGNHECYYSDHFGRYFERLFPNVYMPDCPWNMTVPMNGSLISFTFLSCTLPCFGYLENPNLIRQCRNIRSKYNETTEYDWIENHFREISLNQSIIWKLVFIHYPVFSISARDGDDETLKKFLLPLLLKYKIDVVFSGHNHNMQYFTANYDQIEYIPQNKSSIAKEFFIDCENSKPLCTSVDVSCPENPFVNCSGKLITSENYEFFSGPTQNFFRKGDFLHQVTMGASGANLDFLNLELDTPMAELKFGMSDYGFNEVEITDTQMSIRFIHANSSSIVFESTILK